MKWEGLIKILAKDDFARTFKRWLHTAANSSGYVEKS
jgi:hypothetical protein